MQCQGLCHRKGPLGYAMLFLSDCFRTSHVAPCKEPRKTEGEIIKISPSALSGLAVCSRENLALSLARSAFRLAAMSLGRVPSLSLPEV